MKNEFCAHEAEEKGITLSFEERRTAKENQPVWIISADSVRGRIRYIFRSQRQGRQNQPILPNVFFAMVNGDQPLHLIDGDFSLDSEQLLADRSITSAQLTAVPFQQKQMECEEKL